MRQIHEAYVETGVVRFGYQHFIVLGPDSQVAAEATECAAEQGAFWAYHDLLYDPQASANWGLANANLKHLAAELGLDSTAFDTCLDSGTYTPLVREESGIIASIGVRGTPAFLINGKLLAGAQPFEVFQQIIEAETGATEE